MTDHGQSLSDGEECWLEEEAQDEFDFKLHNNRIKPSLRDRQRRVLPGKIVEKGPCTAKGKKPGKHGKGSGNKARDKARGADRSWKNLQTSSVILGISSEGPSSRNLSGELPSPICISPSKLKHAMSELPLLKADDSEEHHDLSVSPGLRAYGSSDAIGLTNLEPEVKRERWLQRMQSTVEGDGDDQLTSLRDKANILWAELQGADATPQEAGATFGERERYLRRLGGWQRRREGIANSLREYERSSADSAGVEDVWGEVSKVSCELSRLGRDCGSNFANALEILHRFKASDSLRAVALGVGALKFLCRERDNISLDRMADAVSSDGSKDTAAYMCMGGCDVVDGAIEGVRKLQEVVFSVPNCEPYYIINERCQVLVHVWRELGELLQMAGKLARRSGLLRGQKQYYQLLASALMMARKAMQGMKAALQGCPKTAETQEDLLRQCWLPEALSGLHGFVEMVCSRAAVLTAQGNEGTSTQDTPLGGTMAAGEHADGAAETLGTIRQVLPEVHDLLYDFAHDMSRHVAELGAGTLPKGAVMGLEVLEQLACKSIQLVLDIFKSDNHWEYCTTACAEKYNAIMKFSEICVMVLERVRRRLQEEENLDLDFYSYSCSSGHLDQWLRADLMAQTSAESNLVPVLQAAQQQEEEDTSPFFTAEIEASGITHNPSNGSQEPFGGRRAPSGMSRASSGWETSLMTDFRSIRLVHGGELDLQWVIGSGSSGQVRYGTWYSTGDAVAVKVMGLKEDLFNSRDPEVASIQAEWNACQHLRNHHNIVTFHECLWWQKEEGQGPQLLCFVMEYCGYGTLFDMLREARELRDQACSSPSAEQPACPPPERRRQSEHASLTSKLYRMMLLRISVAQQIASGLNFMHAQDVVHRDLTSYNVLLTTGFHQALGGQKMTHLWLNAKICDFGYARRLKSRLSGQSSTKPSIGWQAPEVLQPSSNHGRFSKASDIYSLGVIIWELITLDRPPGVKDFEFLQVMHSVGERHEQLDWRDSHPKEPRLHTREDLMALVKRCWTLEPADRPTAEEVVKELNRIAQEEKLAVRRSSQQRQEVQQASGS